VRPATRSVNAKIGAETNPGRKPHSTRREVWMDWLQFIVQWAHVFFGIFWFGAVLYGDFILIPAITTLPLNTQREIGAAIGPRAQRVIEPVAGAVILLGILRGTVFGRIQSLDALMTQYGLYWTIGLIAALSTFAWAKRVIIPAIDRLNALSPDEVVGTDGQPTPAFASAIDRVKRVTLLELIGFVVILTFMILMRFS
jgi:uncharacterized membrane protein